MMPPDRPSSEREDDEQWFRDHCPDPVTPDLEKFKLATRHARNEQWLASLLRDSVPSEVIERTQRAVHEEAARLRATGRGRAPWSGSALSRTLRPWMRWPAAGLVVAAVVALFFVRTPVAEDGDAYPFSPLSAFEEFRDEAWDTAFAELEENLVEQELTGNMNPDSVFADTRFDDLDDGLEEWMDNPVSLEDGPS